MNLQSKELFINMKEGDIPFWNPVYPFEEQDDDVKQFWMNEAMKLAASQALAELAAEPVPAGVKKVLAEAYPADAAAGMFDSQGGVNVNCVIPKPFDPRVVPRVARRVAEAAMKSGVAQLDIGDLDAYEKSVAERLGK